jgi:hypothetical protein
MRAGNRKGAVMAKPKTVQAARQRAGELRQKLNVRNQSLIERVEFESMRTMEVSESRYYGVVGYAPHAQLRQAVVLMLRRHPHLTLSKEWVADYLNMSAKDVDAYDSFAAKTLAKSSVSPFGTELTLICNLLQVMPNQLIPVPA